MRCGAYPSWLQAIASADVKRARADVAHFAQGMVPVVRATPTVLSVHDMSLVRFWRTHPVRRLLQIPLVLGSPTMANLIIVPSRASADELMRLTGVRAAKIEVVPYAPQQDVAPATGQSVTDALERHGLASGEFILALGTIEPRKNHVRLIEAFEIAVREQLLPRDLELVIAGAAGWRSETILDRIVQSPAASRIRRLGYVPAKDLGALLTSAAAVAYVSLYEGFGLPVIEALACGAPTVTSNVSSMPEVAGDAAFLVDPHDVRSIASGLVEAIRAGDANADDVARNAVAQAAKFSWPAAAQQAVHLYSRLS
jgi:glycosyltransferase involved in cell wall biosynthesis